MAMIRRSILFSFFIVNFSSLISAQTDSCRLRFSLLTCTPGEELYSTFGHSALRVTDSTSKDDIVYNYGTFNFDEPGFYTKFIRGKLFYYLSTTDFYSFAESYVQEKRGITEQILNLDCDEKKRIMQILGNNLSGKNKFYKYDFLFDNCTTRLRDLVEKSTAPGLHYGNVLRQNTSFRQLIYEYLNYNHQEWSKLGIDLLLGSKTDHIMSDREAMFLPDYLMKTFDSTHKGKQPLISGKENIYQPDLPTTNTSFFISPLFIFSVLLTLIVVLTFSKNNFTRNLLNGFDGFLFFIIGLIGLLILFMWFGTDHVMCRNNYNLLWAWPTHTVAAFYMYSSKKPVKYYFRTAIVINLALIVTWFFLPQAFNVSLIPIMLILILRSVIHSGLVNQRRMHEQ
jgi:Domain of unknown function (DUF4105)